MGTGISMDSVDTEPHQEGDEMMETTVVGYDYGRNALWVSSSVVPSMILLTKHDLRDMDMRTVRDYEYVMKDALDDARHKLDEYDNYIQWLCQFVPEDRWDEVYDEMTRMGIDYRGADDV